MKSLKERVKKGEITPAEAYVEAERMALQSPKVRRSQAYRWLKRRLGLEGDVRR